MLYQQQRTLFRNSIRLVSIPFPGEPNQYIYLGKELAVPLRMYGYCMMSLETRLGGSEGLTTTGFTKYVYMLFARVGVNDVFY